MHVVRSRCTQKNSDVSLYLLCIDFVANRKKIYLCFISQYLVIFSIILIKGSSTLYLFCPHETDDLPTCGRPHEVDIKYMSLSWKSYCNDILGIKLKFDYNMMIIYLNCTISTGVGRVGALVESMTFGCILMEFDEI